MFASTLAFSGLFGCAANESAQIERDPLRPTRGGSSSLVFSAPPVWDVYASVGIGDADLHEYARRDGALTPPVDRSLSRVTAWPAPTPPVERRIPVIYSRWGTSF
ncbi:MAG: hypothetical protein EA379_09275 [Phycisphaerales bacterium]|nr:MAG: hypothetical protein EA379_09275 [Phycisphaerales bacterium]